MSDIKLFESQNMRRMWNAAEEQWYFAVVDVVGALTDSNVPKRYWSDLKRKLIAEGSQLYEKIVQLKFKAADGQFLRGKLSQESGVGEWQRTRDTLSRI